MYNVNGFRYVQTYRLHTVPVRKDNRNNWEIVKVSPVPALATEPSQYTMYVLSILYYNMTCYDIYGDSIHPK